MVIIERPQDCCGCTACASICPHGAIQLKANNKGFLYPQINGDVCVECGLCLKTCPILDRRDLQIKESTVKESFALRYRDKDVLYHSSSGGAFYAIAEFVINNGGVVFGAAYDHNMRVSHSFATTLDGCRAFMGSKYSQSDMSGVMEKVKEFLVDGRMVLFTGTPCQNHGLLKYLKKTYNNLITTDIICHSVPSPTFFMSYLKMIEKRFKDKVINISMRDKTLGWGVTESYRYFFSSGKEVLNPRNIVGWQNIFESGFITRECCFDCQYTNLNRVTDFTIGDFWDSHHLRPDLMSKEGTSVVLVNTEKAVELLNKIYNTIDLWPVFENEFLQPRLQNCTKKPEKYDEFWRFYFRKGFRRTYLHFFHNINLVKRIILKIKRIFIKY